MMMKMMIKVSSYLSVSCVERLINSTIRGGWHLPQIKLCRFRLIWLPSLPPQPHPTSPQLKIQPPHFQNLMFQLSKSSCWLSKFRLDLAVDPPNHIQRPRSSKFHQLLTLLLPQRVVAEVRWPDAGFRSERRFDDFPAQPLTCGRAHCFA